MNKEELFWCLGFFESQASFSVNIGLPKSKNRRYVVFKSYICLVNTDSQQISFIKNLLGLDRSNQNPKKKLKKSHNETHSLNIQNFNDIDKIIDVLSSKKFVSKNKQERFDRFVDCYKHIKKVGHIHTEWKDEFDIIITKKLNINKSRSNINKNRFSASQWRKKIQEHLRG